MDIPGNGAFLIAANKEMGPRVIPAPNPQMNGLVLPPHNEVAISEDWLKSPLFMGLVQRGKVSLRRDDLVPQGDRYKIAGEYEHVLTPVDKQFVYALCGLPLDETRLATIHQADLIPARGRIPNTVRVTRDFLKNRHVHTLKAALDLEGRWQNRANVRKELNRAIKKIEAM